MYEFICKNCGRHYYSASPTGVDDRCPVCGGELERTGVEGQLDEKPHRRMPPRRGRPAREGRLDQERQQRRLDAPAISRSVRTEHRSGRARKPTRETILPSLGRQECATANRKRAGVGHRLVSAP